MNFLQRLIGKQEGSVLALTTISMVVLVSFSAGVIDIGQMYETRRQLQNATDGAALAGAKALALGNTNMQVINASLDYVQRNGVSAALVDPGYPVVDGVAPYTNNAVKVSATQHVNLLVARLLNNGVGDINAQATAIVGPVLPTEDLWPWGVPQGAIVPGQEIALKVGSPPPNPGNFGPMDFPPVGGGANSYLDAIEIGYGAGPNDYVSPTLPWDVPTQTGNVVGNTREGIDYLLQHASSSGQDDITSPWNNPTNTCTWQGAPKSASDPSVPPPAGWVGNASSCYRIGVIPILESLEVNGKGQVSIIGWGAFYLVGYNDGPGGRTNVWGYFLDKALVSGGHTNWGAPLSGLIGVRLWQ